MRPPLASRSAAPAAFRALGAGLIVLLAGALLGAGAGGVGSVAAPPRGSDAPPITLPDLSGATVNDASIGARARVLVFGELDHEGAQSACAEVLSVLEDPRLVGAPVLPVLIVAQDASGADLKERAAQGKFPALILHDRKREAFGAYRVLVLPTVVVVNPKGKVVHAMPGMVPRFREILTESILAATGKTSGEALEKAIEAREEPASPEAVRADRLVRLGVELTRHRLYELAEARFSEAIGLAPGHVGAKLGLGELMLRQDRLADAEPIFRSVLGAHPESVGAALGMATVHLRRGGDGLAAAERLLLGILEKTPEDARAHFLLGEVHEKRADLGSAAREYRRAAELLLEGRKGAAE